MATLIEQAEAMRKELERAKGQTEAPTPENPNAAVQAILDQHAAKMGSMMASYERKMAQQYEDLVKAATADIEKATQADFEQATQSQVPADPFGEAQQQNTQQTAQAPVQQPTGPSKQFKAQWIDTESGERWLTLNQAAANYLLLIFDQLSDVLAEVQKLAKQPRGRAR